MVAENSIGEDCGVVGASLKPRIDRRTRTTMSSNWVTNIAIAIGQ